MTLNYNREVSTSHPWTFLLLLFKWKASIWKAVYLELTIFVLLYAFLSVIYRFALDTGQQGSFRKVSSYLEHTMGYIPLELILGFFCTQVVNRWTKLYQTIGFIDNVGLMTALYVRGRSEKARIYRRNIMRYSELVQVLVFRDISMRTRRRFPTLDTVVAAGLMLPHEKELFESYEEKENAPKYWIPANWALSMTYMAWKDGYIESDYYKTVVEAEIRTWRTNIEWVFNYDWVPFPLMYPQLVCLVVHLHFAAAAMARQTAVASDGKDDIDTFFPFMTTFQFVFYMGWLKVIEQLLNPFGEDDDDFETNALIDRNITMGLKMVDDGYDITPDQRRDPFWDQDDLHPLYSEEASHIRNHPYRGSVSAIRLDNKASDVVMVPHSSSEANFRRMKSSTPKLIKVHTIAEGFRDPFDGGVAEPQAPHRRRAYSVRTLSDDGDGPINFNVY